MMSRLIGENLKRVIIKIFNNLPLQIWTLKCSLNSLTLKFCRYDVSALPIPVLNPGPAGPVWIRIRYACLFGGLRIYPGSPGK